MPCLHLPATCNDCDFSFEHLIGYNNYICDLDGHDVSMSTPPRLGMPAEADSGLRGGLNHDH